MTNRVNRSGRARALGSLVPLALALVGCGEGPSTGEPTEQIDSQDRAVVSIDPRRSLVVTEQSILQRFPLKRVLDQLVAQSGVSGLTSTNLFHQWWDTQNPKPGLGLGPHCDDQMDPALGPVLNSFPYFCRPAPSEGAQASCDPFAATDTPCTYIPIGLFNRFDLAPEDGAFCGEYRIVYAKKTGIATSDDRNLLIFEAAMPNPLPQIGLEGCRPLARLWANLSNINNANERANQLESFYFIGLASASGQSQSPFPPVVQIANYGDNPAGRGQIRTNQFSAPAPRLWSLREFKLLRTCALSSCSAMQFVPVTTKDSPYGPLFDPLLPHPRAADFQSLLPSEIGTLGGATLFDIGEDIPDAYNTAQSQASGTETNYLVQLTSAPSTLRTNLGNALTAAGSSLTPDNIVARVQALSCAGCHRISNNADLGGGLIWPPSLGFTHITERQTEVVNGETRYVISNALTQAFLPHRQDVFQRYLSNSLMVKHQPHRPIGGLKVH